MKVKVTITHKHLKPIRQPRNGIPLINIPMMSDSRWNELARQQEVKTA